MNKAFSHSNEPALARHFSNAVLKVDSYGGRVTKDSKTSSRKVDLVIASILALDRAVPPEPEYNILDSVL